jgi:hypothetical protein
MEPTNIALILLSSAIVFSLIIERLLEIVKSLYDYMESKHDWTRFWNRRAKNLQRRFNNKLLNPHDNGLYYSTIIELVGNSGDKKIASPEIMASKVRRLYLKFIFKFLGVLAGISIAWLMSINIFDLIETLGCVNVGDASNLQSCVPADNSTDLEGTFLLKSKISWDWLEITLSGVVIGLGSTPIHKIISAMDTRKKSKE